MKVKKVVYIGDLIIWEQEGGHAADAVEIKPEDGIAAYVDRDELKRHFIPFQETSLYTVFRNMRVTIEKLEDE